MTQEEKGKKKCQSTPHPRLKAFCVNEKLFDKQLYTVRFSLYCEPRNPYQQSNPSCVFLPVLLACRDTHFDSSTEDTAQSLREKVIRLSSESLNIALLAFFPQQMFYKVVYR